MLPFDKRYLNDIAFVIDRPLIPINQIGIGCGDLIPYYGFGANLAKSCWLIDDYCIQFSSADQNMYIYDMVKRTCIKYQLNSFIQEEIEWMRMCCKHSNSILLKVKELRNQQTSERGRAIGKMYASYFNVLFCEFNSVIPQYRIEVLKDDIEFLNYNWDTEYKNGSFYKGGTLLTWGEISRSIANLIKNE